LNYRDYRYSEACANAGPENAERERMSCNIQSHPAWVGNTTGHLRIPPRYRVRLKNSRRFPEFANAGDPSGGDGNPPRCEKKGRCESALGEVAGSCEESGIALRRCLTRPAGFDL